MSRAGQEANEGLLQDLSLGPMILPCIRRQLRELESGMFLDLDAIESVLFLTLKYLEALDALAPYSAVRAAS